MAMTMAQAEMVNKILELGINRVKVRPIRGGWAILHQIDSEHAESILRVDTKEECYELIALATKEAQLMNKCCENCINAIYDSVPYGSTSANYLSGCKCEDEVFEEELEGIIECRCWKGDKENDNK